MSRRLGSGELVLPVDAPRDVWLAARREGITATDVVKIVGASPYGNALDVYLDCRLGEVDYAPSESAAWGLALEGNVAAEWARRRGARIRRVGLMRNRIHPHHMASCDRIVLREHAPLECKTRNLFAADLADGVPERVAIQVQWQMHVIGAEHAHVAALIGGQTLVSHEVQRDQVLIDYLRSEADRVCAAVQAGRPPEVPAWQQTSAALDRLYPDRAGEVEVDPDLAQPLIEQYRMYSTAEKHAKSERERVRVQLIELLGDHSTALIGGIPAYSYKPTTSTGIPAERARALLDAHPDLAAEYAVTTTTRRFTLSRKAS